MSGGYQEEILPLLTSLHYEQGKLLGSMRSIGFSLQAESVLETFSQDVIKSSQIEGEILDHALVRSSVAFHLGIDVAALHRKDRVVDGVVEVVLDATLKFNEPLTRQRLFSWHSSLFPSGRSGFSKLKIGAFRKGPCDVVSR